MKRYLLITLYALSALVLRSQAVQHFGPENGLSGLDVTSISKNEHYIWIGTEDGLNRFNGHDFKTYKAGGANSIYSNTIEALYTDRRGMLWIGFKSGGADIYNPRNDRFYRLSELTDGKIPNRVISIYEDSSGKIWLGSWEEGACVLTPDADGEHYESKICLSGSIVSSFAESPDGKIWIATYNGLVLYDAVADRWDKIDDTLSITSIVEDRDRDALYYSTWNNEIFRVSGPGHDCELLCRCRYPVNCLLYKDNHIIIGTWGGETEAYDLTAGRLNDHTVHREIGTVYAGSMFLDDNGNIWIGSYGKGLYKYCHPANGFTSLLNIKDTHLQITAISSLKGRLLLGTRGDGLFLYDIDRKTETPIFRAGNTFKDCILTIGSAEGFTLVGHDDVGLLYTFGDPTGRWHEYAPDKSLGKITAFCFRGNKVWIGTKQNGIMSVTLDRRAGTVTDFQHFMPMGHDRVNAIAPYRDGRLLVATHNGLYIIDPANEADGAETVINSETIHCVLEDRYSRSWWIGSSRSLLKMELKDGRPVITDVLARIGLPGDAVRFMKLDNAGNLWFFIGDCMFCLQAETGTVVEPDMRRSGDLAYFSCDIDEIDGRQYLYMGSSTQLMAAEVEKVLEGKAQSDVVLTGLDINHSRVNVGDIINGEVILKASTEYITSLSLPYDSKWISLSLADTDEADFRYHYLYRLRGFSDTWQYLDIEEPITFSQLNSGKYTLEIRTVDSDTPCWSLPLEVQTPWWKSAPFIAVCSLLFIGLIALIIYLVTRHNRNKQIQKMKEVRTAQMEQMLQYKESFFQSLGHDIITPLSLVIAPAKDMLRETPEDDIRHEQLSIIVWNASYLSNLFGSMLDFRQAEDSNMKIEKKTTSIVTFTKFITNAFKHLTDSRNISLSYHSDIEEATILIDRIKFERILFNLLSNAIKYTPDGGKVSVDLGLNGDTLKVSVSDTGPGIEKQHHADIFDKFYREPQYCRDNAPTGLGIGLYLVKKFVEVLEGSVSIDSAENCGTTITITLPVTGQNDAADGTQAAPGDDTAPGDGRPSILLVEDNQQILEYLASKLSEHFNTLRASNADDALRLINEHMPEIVISDIMMPGTDGLTLCRMIKDNPLTADIFVVILTAKVSAEDELKGYRQGADIYIRKPFDTEALINQLKNIINTRCQRKVLLMKNLVADSGEEVSRDSNDDFLRLAMQVIEENIANPDFSIEEFADGMKVSKTVLHKKFRVLTDQTPGQFIRDTRLRKAAVLLENTDIPIAEIAYRTGFNQAHYFIKCFKKVYNVTPKKYRDSRHQTTS